MAIQHLGCRYARLKMMFQSTSNIFTLLCEICAIDFLHASSPFRMYTDLLPPRTFGLRNSHPPLIWFLLKYTPLKYAPSLSIKWSLCPQYLVVISNGKRTHHLGTFSIVNEFFEFECASYLGEINLHHWSQQDSFYVIDLGSSYGIQNMGIGIMNLHNKNIPLLLPPFGLCLSTSAFSEKRNMYHPTFFVKAYPLPH